MNSFISPLTFCPLSLKKKAEEGRGSLKDNSLIPNIFIHTFMNRKYKGAFQIKGAFLTINRLRASSYQRLLWPKWIILNAAAAAKIKKIKGIRLFLSIFPGSIFLF